MSNPQRGPSNSVGKWVFASIFLIAGIGHFLALDFFLKVMPPSLPYPRELVLISGVCEIALAVLLLIPKTQRLAAWGLVALLIAVFPANIHVFLNWEQFPPQGTLPVPPTMIWLGHLIRLPLQGVLIYWAYKYTRDPLKRADLPPSTVEG